MVRHPRGVASAAHRLPLLALAAAAFALITSAFFVFERPGLGIGHFYYFAIALAAFAAGPYVGALAGVLAIVLEDIGIAVNPNLKTTFPVEQTAIRLVTFAGVGLLVGWFARSHRSLVQELSDLANRDEVTRLPNTRAFEAAIEARLTAGDGFALLVGDVDELRRVNDLGREAGDDALRRLADQLIAAKRGDDHVARVGGDEFAILAALGAEDGKSLALGIERHLTFAGDSVTFGWATYPQDGENALALYRAADERLYARKVARGYRRGPELRSAPA